MTKKGPMHCPTTSIRKQANKVPTDVDAAAAAVTEIPLRMVMVTTMIKTLQQMRTPTQTQTAMQRRTLRSAGGETQI